MKNVTFILGLILGLLLFNSSTPDMSYNNDSPKTRLDSLMSKKWKSNTNKSSTIETYQKDTMVSIVKLDNGKVFTIKKVYYLTDDISKMGKSGEEFITNFDWDRVGKSLKGKYLVTLTIRPNEKKNIRVCNLSEIVELTDSKLVLRYVVPSEWAASPNIVYNAEPLD